MSEQSAERAILLDEVRIEPPRNGWYRLTLHMKHVGGGPLDLSKALRQYADHLDSHGHGRVEFAPATGRTGEGVER